VKLTTHLHLVPRSRMHGTIPPLLQYPFKAWYSVKKHKDLKKSEKNIISYFIYKSKANQDRAIYQHKKPEMMMKITPGEIYLFLLDKFFSSLPPVANFVL